MKKILLTSLSTIYYLSSFAQEKEGPSFSETISYLNEKIEEVKSHFRNDVYSDGSPFKMYYPGYLSISGYDAKSFTIQYAFSNYPVRLYTNEEVRDAQGRFKYWKEIFDCDYLRVLRNYKFNPALIKSIEFSSKPGDPVGVIKIYLIDKVATFTYTRSTVKLDKDGECSVYSDENDVTTSESYVEFPFLQSDPDNFNRIKKALEHLKKISKGKDLFGD
ncbi:hypothetical protein [Emticicia sp. TH156]|uniref:hypothetical protein n=1 Tax=Emticicia sp. TH156 TaxID=2067454 RepID=UPI000C7763D1|nr:hypothetical protein [Emticicia sp. TH156]PLK42650.1 hypothetical protein C0V77_19120 [Emticicia sp. TH156]